MPAAVADSAHWTPSFADALLPAARDARRLIDGARHTPVAASKLIVDELSSKEAPRHVT